MAGKNVAFHVVKGGPSPLRCRSSALAAAAVGVGFRFSCEKPFSHWIEKISGVITRQVTWTFDADFKAKVDGRKMTFAEFRQRFEDDRWIIANPTSEIARLRRTAEGLQFWMNGILSRPPHLFVRRGGRFAIIPHDATPERKAELLEQLAK